MVRKGLIAPDMSDSELEDLLEAEEEEFQDSEPPPCRVSKGRKRRSKIHKRDKDSQGKDLREEVIITSPSETTIYRNAVPFENDSNLQPLTLNDSSDEQAMDTSGSNDDRDTGNNIEYIADRSRSRDHGERRHRSRRRRHGKSLTRSCTQSRSRSQRHSQWHSRSKER